MSDILTYIGETSPLPDDLCITEAPTSLTRVSNDWYVGPYVLYCKSRKTDLPEGESYAIGINTNQYLGYTSSNYFLNTESLNLFKYLDQKILLKIRFWYRKDNISTANNINLSIGFEYIEVINLTIANVSDNNWHLIDTLVEYTLPYRSEDIGYQATRFGISGRCNDETMFDKFSWSISGLSIKAYLAPETFTIVPSVNSGKPIVNRPNLLIDTSANKYPVQTDNGAYIVNKLN